MKNLFSSTFSTLSNSNNTKRNYAKKSFNDLQGVQLSKNQITSIKGGNGTAADEIEIIITDIIGS